MSRSLGKLAGGLLRIGQAAADIAFVAAMFSLLCLFCLQFFHSPRLNHLSAVVELKKAWNPILTGLGSLIQTDWPVYTGFSFIPLGMVFFVWLVKIGIDGIFLSAHRAAGRLGRNQEPAIRIPRSSWTGSTEAALKQEPPRL